MRKLFAIIGILFGCVAIYFGFQFLNEEAVTPPHSASSAPYSYDSGYATFGADFYTFATNNAAEAASATRTVASNQIQLFKLMSHFYGCVLIVLGAMGVCLFGFLFFEKEPETPATPVVSNIEKEEQKRLEEEQIKEEEQKRLKEQQIIEEKKHLEEERRKEEEQKRLEDERRIEEERKQFEEDQRRLSSINKETKFICASCGATNSGWYQKCPNCGTAGSMKRNSVEEQKRFEEHHREEEERKRLEAEQRLLADIKRKTKFICTSCGTTNTGWYQKCPNCGAVGTMKRNSGE